MNFMVWEMASRRFSVYSTLLGPTVDTRSCVSLRRLGEFPSFLYVKADSVFTRGNLDIVSCPLVSGSYLFGVHTSFYSSTQWIQFLRQYGGLGRIYTDFYVKVVLGSRGRFWRDTQLGSSVDTLTRRSTESLASCASVRVSEAFCCIFGFRPTLRPMWRGRRESDSQVFCHRY